MVAHAQKSLLAISVVLLLAAGVAAMSVSSAATPSASRPRVWPKPSAANAAAATTAAEAATKAKHATRLVLILRLVDARDFDAPPVGAEGPGDTTLATFDAFTPGGRRVGHTEARFTTMFRDETFAEVTILLDGRSQILLEGIAGPPDTDPQPVVAVVGGTGKFRNARGQVFRLPGPTPDEIKLVFALLLSPSHHTNPAAGRPSPMGGPAAGMPSPGILQPRRSPATCATCAPCGQHSA